LKKHESDQPELYVVESYDGTNKAVKKAPHGFDWSQLVADFDSCRDSLRPTPRNDKESPKQTAGRDRAGKVTPFDVATSSNSRLDVFTGLSCSDNLKLCFVTFATNRRLEAFYGFMVGFGLEQKATFGLRILTGVIERTKLSGHSGKQCLHRNRKIGAVGCLAAR
jgi:hypothetical protein